MKARSSREVKRFEDIPNIGPRIARDFELIGITTPQDLKGRNAHKLYQKLCTVTGVRHDPCVLDTFMAAVDFMDGAPARPWWKYTKTRKEKYPTL